VAWAFDVVITGVISGLAGGVKWGTFQPRMGKGMLKRRKQREWRLAVIERTERKRGKGEEENHFEWTADV
jgi:hypothetical protein